MHLSGFDIGEELSGRGEHRFCRARRTNDGRCVLLRLSDNGAGSATHARARLERELEICRDLGVDGVLTALDLVVGVDGAALVLADAPGATLDHVLGRRGGTLPLASALSVGAQLAATLSALHRRDLVHRDLRPANVLYDEDSGQVTLTGLGRASQVPREAWRIRAPDRLEGDPAYLAPEATGRINRRLDYRADLYSLGVVLFELLTGQPPFDDTDPAVLIHAHIALDPPDPGELRQGLPAAVSAIVGKLLAKAAEERYQSGLGLRHDLQRCLADLESGGGDARPFVPGERDVAERFELPQGLFGREAEMRWLEEALAVVAPPRSPQGDAAAAGRRLVRLVAGYSGVGKTSLIEEIRFSVLRRRGLFASGNFDPKSSATPYHGILHALHDLVLQKLGAKPEQAQGWAERLVGELGANLGVMTEILPELLSLVGEPPTVPKVPPENARNRFHGCVGRFLTTFGEDDAPLVLFLDDLQWVDPASLELLENLLTVGVGAFLLLGAYRDNEVDDNHALQRTVLELSARGVDLDTLRLPPLAEPALSRMIAEALHLPSSEVAPLADLVYRKTAGNPFFARTFLSTLYKRRLLRFTATASPPRWTWDLEAMTALRVTENVIELVADRLTELPATSRRTVAVAAVLGKEIDLGTLAAICGPDVSTVESTLLEACREGLLVKVGTSAPRYAFVHDRVREGAYGLLRQEELAGVHLRIGRLLRDRAATGGAAAGRAASGPPQAGLAARDVFEIANHLNSAAHLLTDPAERREMVQLEADAGRQAKASGAFATAHSYFRRALEHLVLREDADPWHEEYELTRTLHAEAAEAAALAQDYGAAERLSGVLLTNARDLLGAMPAYETRMYLHHARREEEAAIRVGFDALGRLGIEIPFHPEAVDVRAAVLAADRTVETVLAEVEESGVEALPVMRDPAHLAAAWLLMRLGRLTVFARPRLFRSIACRLAEVTATHGVGPVSPIAFLFMGELRCTDLENLAGGRRLGELAQYPPASGLAQNARTIFDFSIGCRTVHPAALVERFAEHYRHTVDSGDLQLAGGIGFDASLAALVGGSELAKAEALALGYHAEVQGSGQIMSARVIEGLARLAAVLRGRGTVEEAVDLAEFPPEVVASIRPRLIGAEMMVRCLLREGEAALRTARESLTIESDLPPVVPFDFYRCLIFLDDDPGAPELAACRARLEAQAEATPELYGHKRDLVTAHGHRVAGRTEEALALYEKAVADARRNGFPYEEALAREMAGELYLELGRQSAAGATLGEAVAAYRRWGARAKVDQLFETYPDLLSTPADPSASLDVASLQRAENLLQTELDLGKLLRRLIALLLQNAGARRGFLLRDSHSGIVIEANGCVGGEVDLPEDEILDTYRDIAATVVRFVARTHETVALGEASRDPRFASDPYLERARPRSILCFSLLHRGQTVEIVYLENDRSPDVFSPERTTAVRLIASQAAGALQNARLHHSLKQEVETRRRAEADLRRALDEVAALKDRFEAENVYLQQEIKSHFEEIVGDSESIRKVHYKLEQVAATDATVLILGETGTGKELFARALHRLSPRRERPLVKVNCAALPATLIESELFGHEKGAFTGALSRKMGRFELADSGTLFLDEIGDLPLELQAKLLRVLQEGEFERLGGAKTMKVDVRIIAATNRDLERAMADGTFRSDLYYRLTVFPIELPPLRERGGDIALLVRYFVGRKRGKLRSRVEKIPHQAMERFAAYPWPGNVRELENVVERALILSPGETLRLDESFGEDQAPASSERLVDLECAHIRGVLEACGWKIKGKGNAAERLGLPPPTLRDRMKRLGIVRPGA